MKEKCEMCDAPSIYNAKDDIPDKKDLPMCPYHVTFMLIARSFHQLAPGGKFIDSMHAAESLLNIVKIQMYGRFTPEMAAAINLSTIKDIITKANTPNDLFKKGGNKNV